MQSRLKSVGALLVNRQGKVLLQQRDDRPDLLYPGHWTTLGGAVEPGETPEAAIRRELLEEIELEIELKLWQQFEHVVQLGGQEIKVDQYLFTGQIDLGVDEITLNEGQGIRFFNLNDLDGLPVAFGFKPWLRQFFECRGSL